MYLKETAASTVKRYRVCYYDCGVKLAESKLFDELFRAVMDAHAYALLDSIQGNHIGHAAIVIAELADGSEICLDYMRMER